MTNSRKSKPAFGRVRRHVVATSLAALLVFAGGVGQALAQEDDDELPDTKFFKSMLSGLGLKKDGDLKSGITYQERPPLVVPPTRDLPPPQTADAVRGNAAWPKDQDEQRRREAAVKRKKEAKPFDWSDLGAQMSPNELKKGATTAKDQAMSRKPQEFEEYNRQYKPDELSSTGGLFGSVKDFFGVGGGSGVSVPFEAEPPRASLTDPPTGYRTPSAAQPYGVGKDTSKSKALTPEDRVGATDLPASH